MNDEMWKIIKHYGIGYQSDVWVEELSELIKVICKWQRNGKLTPELLKDFTTEMADVENILTQMKMVFMNDREIQEEREYKIKRQLVRMNKEGNMKKVKILYKDKPIFEFETETDDFGEIIETLYTKYKDAIGFEIKSIDKVKTKRDLKK